MMKDSIIPTQNKKNISFLFIVMLFLGVLSLPVCRTVSVRTAPGDQNGERVYFFYNIKAKVIHSGKKESFRVSLKYNSLVDRIIFLGPLNQVLFKTFITGEETLLIIPNKKKYWRGSFSDFLYKFWNIEMTYSELKNLLLNRILPHKKIGEKYPEIKILKFKKRYTRIDVSMKDIVLIFKVPVGKKRIGVIKTEKNLSGYKRFELSQIKFNGK